MKRATKLNNIRAAKRAAKRAAEQAKTEEELALLRALWLAQSDGVPPMNDRQLIMFGKNMLKNLR